MGTDITCRAERRDKGGNWITIDGLSPFNWRSYGIFGFLADVRNHSAVPPIAPQRGLPDDVDPATRDYYEDWENGNHGASWLTLRELLVFDYDQEFEDRRMIRNGDGGVTCDPGEGKRVTYREFLGDAYFDDIEELKAAGAERIVFWFDC
jgi:hypothetical protein